MRRKRFALFLAAGALCPTAALGLTVYNIWDEQRAAASASEAVEVLAKAIPERPETEQPPTPEP